MPLILYGHPFSAYTQKVLVALYEHDTTFTFRCLGPETPHYLQDWEARWPLKEFPLLVDEGRNVAESSIIIEHLQLAHGGTTRLIPDTPAAALEIRFLDRFFDLHVINEVQQAIAAVTSGDPARAEEGLARGRDKLEIAYAWLEPRLAGKTWAGGDAFTLADCAAAPSLFYADWTHPVSDRYPLLRAYRQRLLDRPSFRRAVEGGRPFRHLFPLGAPERD